MGMTLSVRYVCGSSAEHGGGEPHRGQCRLGPTTRADHCGKALGWCLEPRLIFSFLSEFLLTLRKVDLNLVGKLTKGRKINAYFLRTEDGQTAGRLPYEVLLY